MKKIQLLNDILTQSPFCVVVPFTPIAIPVRNDGYIGDPNVSTTPHYATFVYSTHQKKFYLWEFPESIYVGLCAYQERRSKMNVENPGWLQVLLSRDSNFKLSMTSGGYHTVVDIPTQDFQVFSERMCQLYDKYLNKQNYKLADVARGY